MMYPRGVRPADVVDHVDVVVTRRQAPAVRHVEVGPNDETKKDRQKNMAVS